MKFTKGIFYFGRSKMSQLHIMFNEAGTPFNFTFSWYKKEHIKDGKKGYLYVHFFGKRWLKWLT